MDMTIAEYESLVTRLERSAERSPGAYKAKVVGLALLGYSYIFGVLIVLLALVLGLGALVLIKPLLLAKIGFKLLIPLAVVIGVCAKAIWVRLGEPEGRALTPDEAPELFAELKRIRKDLGAPRVHEVIITDDFNAAITQVPRLGLFGWQKNYLILGLPLMMTLTLDEFRAVVAHEMGHLAGNHGKFSAWIYRLRMTWYRIKASFDDGQNASMLFNRFFNWFVPYFGAYSFVLARQDEYEADRSAAEVSGAQVAGAALVKTHVLGAYLGEKFWPKLFERNQREEEAPRRLFVEMHTELNASVESADAQMLLTQALQRQTGFDDTHPSLSDRLEALGVEAELPPPAEQSAGDVLLAGVHETLTEEFSREWHASVRRKWQKIHAESRSGRERLAELRELRGERELGDQELWQLATLTERFDSEEEALELFQAYLDTYPEDADGHYVVGRLLLSQDDEAGLGCLETAIEKNVAHTPHACRDAVEFFFRNHRRAEAQRWIDRHDVYQHRMAEARQERNTLKPGDTFFGASLEPEQLAQLRSQLDMYPTIEEAYIACKDVRHFKEVPLYVLGIVPHTGLFGGGEEVEELLQMILDEVEFPGETFVINLKDSEFSWLRTPLEQASGSRIL
jgi:Zn-dependent protease with chaperone function